MWSTFRALHRPSFNIHTLKHHRLSFAFRKNPPPTIEKEKKEIKEFKKPGDLAPHSEEERKLKIESKKVKMLQVKLQEFKIQELKQEKLRRESSERQSILYSPSHSLYKNKIMWSTFRALHRRSFNIHTLQRHRLSFSTFWKNPPPTIEEEKKEVKEFKKPGDLAPHSEEEKKLKIESKKEKILQAKLQEFKIQKLKQEKLRRESSERQSMLKKVRSGVLLLQTRAIFQKIVVEGGCGSGFLVSKSLGATNAHVVCEKYKVMKPDGEFSLRWVTSKVRARFPGGRLFDVKVVAIDIARDLALFKIPKRMVKQANFVSPLCLDNLRLGQRLFFVGSPGIPFCIKSGIYSSMRTLREIVAADLECIYLDCELIDRVSPRHLVVEIEGCAAPGISGSLVVDELGQVVAVIFAGSDEVQESAGAPCAFAVPVQCLVDLMSWASTKKVGQSIFVDGEDCISGADRALYDEFDAEDNFPGEEDPSR